MQSAVSVFTSILCVGVLFASLEHEDLRPLDHSTIDLTQFEEIDKTERIAEVKTSKGEIKIRFFEKEAPEFSKSFENLLEQGYFKNSELGLQEEDGDKGGKLIVHPSRRIADLVKNSYDTPSANLIHIPGSVSAVLDSNGVPTGEIFILTEREVSKSEIEDMKSCSYPKEIIDKFKEYGGYPKLWLKSPIFAQVYDGMDVIEDIKEGYENGETIHIESVVIKLSDGQLINLDNLGNSFESYS